MAFENGYKAIDYISNLIDNYNKDPMIFMKALQIFNTYKLQSTWPHNYQSMNESLSLLLGTQHEIIINFTAQFIGLKRLNLHREDSKKIEWPESVSQTFINELILYYNTIHQDLEQASMARIKPIKFAGLTRSQVPMSKTKILKLIRMDNESLEFEVDKADVKSIIRSLEIMIQDSCELNDEA